MSALSAGMLVRHASLGVGKVVAIDAGSVHVFFPRSESRFAAKFQVASAPSFLASGDVARDAWLEGLTSFALDPESRRYALAANWLTHDEAIARFRAACPGGFAADGEGPGRCPRAARWRTAVGAWATALGGGQAERLLADGDIGELVRRAVSVGRQAALVPNALDPAAIEETLADETTAGPFFDALLALLSVPSPARARFDRLYAAVGALDAEPAVAWPLATLFPFLADPSRYVFLSPRIASAATERLGHDLRFAPEPSWAPYSSLRSLSTTLRVELAPLGARDFVDVEAFLHATATDRGAAGKTPRVPRAAPARKVAAPTASQAVAKRKARSAAR